MTEKQSPTVEEERLNRSTHKKSQKRQKKLAKKNLKKKSVTRKIVKGVMVTGITVTGLGLVGIGIGGAYAWHEHGDMIQESVTEGYEIAETVKETDFVTKSPTKIVDKNGDVLKVFKEFQYESPTYKELNPQFLDALISAEDERFHDHHGVDLYGTIRGIVSTVQGNGVQGGSTITQQLVRNVILESAEVTVERKLTEQVVSQELEKTMGKDEIIRHYLNNVYFGNGNYGVAPASRYYFSKEQKDIELHEAATIIGITNNPSLFDPITNPESSLKKRNRVLGKMLEVGKITKAQHDEAVAKPLEVKVTEHGIDNSVSEPALGYAVNKATEHLMAKKGFVFQYTFSDDDARKTYKDKYNEEFVKMRQSILNGGYFIETSIDMEKQEALEGVVEQIMSPYYGKDPETGFYTTQTAITTVDNETGEVVAIVGGRGEDGNVFNRGYQGVRQPGSTIKPLVSYTPAFERGYTPESKLEDSAIKNGPVNVYAGYKGMVTLRYATEISINTVAYKLAKETGGEAIVEKLAKQKFASLAPEDENPIISVGGFTYGVTTVEMASGYASVANQGVFKEPSNVRLIKDIVTEEVLYERDSKERKVYDSGASYLMVDVLKSVMKDGSGARAMPSNYPHVIGKTGTTNGNKDIWFVGGTPHYTTAIWTGRDRPSAIPENQRMLAGDIFQKWNETLHEGVKVKDFARPSTVWKKDGKWVASVNQVERERINRKSADNVRRESEVVAQRERLALQDYRIIHGLTKEEETARENAVEKAMNEFYAISFDDLEQYEEQMELLDAIKPLIQEVKHKPAYEKFVVDWNASYDRINDKRDAFLAEIEFKKQEEERLKREAEEAIRMEEERKIQEEVERRLQEELEILEAEEAERERLEQERLEQERIENELQNPPEDTTPVEPEPVEPEPEPTEPEDGVVEEVVAPADTNE